MKKFLLVLCLAVVSFGATAQETKTEKPYWKGLETNKFWDNWEVSAGVGVSYLDVTTKSKDAGKFFNSLGWDLNIAATKWFSPVLGVRLQLDGGQFKNYSYEKDIYGAGAFKTPYVFVHGDVMVNFSNWVGGYREDRVYYAVPYLGFGYTAMSWTKKSAGSYNGEFAATFGLLNKFRVCESIDVQLDLRTWIFAEEGLPAQIVGGGRYTAALVASVGVAYRFNKRGWGTAATQTDVDGYVDAINKLKRDLQYADDNMKAVKDQVADLEKQNAQLKKQIAPVGDTIVNAHTVVFFDKNESELSAFSMATIDKYVSSLKSADTQIVLVGHADSETGTQEYNKAISQKRAEAVKEYMVAKGIKADRIEVKWSGADDQPFVDGEAEVNRCVVIM